jgi:MoaA/NifB/PqqE/SkfB family radical SAM enzyme
MSKIIRIEPTDDVFSITWTMHLRCNYDCMYCGDVRHEYNQGKVLSLEELQSYWNQVYQKTKHTNKLYKLVLSGGEPTVNKNLLPFVNWLRNTFKDRIFQLGLCTNGSASKSYYLDLFEYFDWISFSTHTEYLDEEKFFNSAVACNLYAKETCNKSFMIKIMPEPWASNSVQRFIQICQQNNIHYDLADHIDMSRQTRAHPIFKIKSYD